MLLHRNPERTARGIAGQVVAEKYVDLNSYHENLFNVVVRDEVRQSGFRSDNCQDLEIIYGEWLGQIAAASLGRIRQKIGTKGAELLVELAPIAGQAVLDSTEEMRCGIINSYYYEAKGKNKTPLNYMDRTEVALPTVRLTENPVNTTIDIPSSPELGIFGALCAATGASATTMVKREQAALAGSIQDFLALVV